MEASEDVVHKDRGLSLRPGPLENETLVRNSNLLEVTHPKYRHGGKGLEVLLCSGYRNSIDRFSGLYFLLAQDTCPGTAQPGERVRQ